MKFKKGDIVEVIQKDYSGGKVYEVGSRWNVVREKNKDKEVVIDLVFVEDARQSNGIGILYESSVKKVEEEQEELMIPISLVYQALESEPTNREIKAFLKGYKEGLNKQLTK